MLQSHLIAIEKYSGVRNGEIRADFYDDCQNIPDPSALDPTQKNLLLLDDCYLGKQNKAEVYYTRTQQLRYDIHCSKLFPLTPPYNSGEFELYYPFPTRHEESHTYTYTYTYIHIYIYIGDIPLLDFKQFCHRVWSEEHNFVTIDLTSTPTNGKYRQNFNRFYFPTGTV